MLTSTLLLALGTKEASARSQGFQSLSCEACHSSTQPAELNIRFEPPEPAPGQLTTVIVTVAGNNPTSAGIAIQAPEVGTLSIPADEQLTLLDEWAVHSQPKTAIDGQVEFRVQWLPPDEPGAAQFQVAAVAANGDRRASGDRGAHDSVFLAYGCEAFTLFRDLDEDGIGSSDYQIVKACTQQPGYSTLDGDCDESSATTYPGAEELCNGVDDDCNGEIDDGAVLNTFYLDADGDGYGDPKSPVEGCTAMAGYVDNATDCHDGTSSVNPSQTEVCDFTDNNCDGRIDEGVRARCGVGLCERESEFCGSACIPGEPLQELCNGLDDDCDGLTDESGCDEGQVCINRACVDSADAAVSAVTTDLGNDTMSAAPVTPGGDAQAPTDPAIALPGASPSEPAAQALEPAAGDASAPSTQTGSDAAVSPVAVSPVAALAAGGDTQPGAEPAQASTKGGCMLAVPRSKVSNRPWLAATLSGLIWLGRRRRSRTIPHVQ